MKLDHHLRRAPREHYDEVKYRDSLRALGLVPPIVVEDIHRAYKQRARQFHPDRFTTDIEKAEANRRIVRINTARDYAVRHFRGFAIYQARAYPKNGNGRGASRPARRGPGGLGGFGKLLLLPITAVHALAMVAAAAPFLLLARLMGDVRLHRLRRRWGTNGVFAWRAWLAFGPHALTALAIVLVDGPALELWLGVSLLVMVASDVATGVTGDVNTLRRHPAVHGARRMLHHAA